MHPVNILRISALSLVLGNRNSNNQLCTCFQNEKSKRPELQKWLVNSTHTRAIFFRQGFTLRILVMQNSYSLTELRHMIIVG